MPCRCSVLKWPQKQYLDICAMWCPVVMWHRAAPCGTVRAAPRGTCLSCVSWSFSSSLDISSCMSSSSSTTWPHVTAWCHTSLLSPGFTLQENKTVDQTNSHHKFRKYMLWICAYPLKAIRESKCRKRLCFDRYTSGHVPLNTIRRYSWHSTTRRRIVYDCIILYL